MKLGDYIHYRYKNYKKYGIAYSNGKRPEPITKIMNDWKQEILIQFPQVPKTVIYELQKNLNFYYGNTMSTNQSLNAQQKHILEQLVKNKLEEEVGKRIRNYTLDFETLQAYRIVEASQQEASKKFKDLQSENYSYLGSVHNRLKRLDQALALLPPGADLSDAIKKFQVQYTNIVQEVYARTDSDSQFSRISSKEWNNFRIALNELVARCKFDIDKDITGKMAEYVAILVPQILAIKTEQCTKEILKPLLDVAHKGTQTSAKVIDENLVLGGKLSSRIAATSGKVVYSQSIGKNNKVSVDVTYTQDKVDAILRTSMGEIPASVKNIGTKSSSINILKGSSLLKYLQLYPEYGNHYLNITANLNRKQHNKAPSSDVAIAHRGMLAAVGAHALAGGLIGQKKIGNGLYTIGKTEKALVLVVNYRNGSSGSFRAYSINDILQNIEDNLSFSGGFNGNVPVEWNNTKLPAYKSNVSAAYARCVNVLQQLHNQKLNISLKISALKNI